MLEYLTPTKPNRRTTELRSAYWSDPMLRPLILDYLDDFERAVGDLSQTLLKGKASSDGMLSVERLAATAGLYGYPSITEAAHEMATMVEIDPLPVEMITEQIEALQKLAASARRGTRPGCE